MPDPVMDRILREQALSAKEYAERKNRSTKQYVDDWLLAEAFKRLGVANG